MSLLEIPLERAHELIQPAEPLDDLATEEHDDTTREARLYDNGLSAEEGLWNRSGWAGRT